MNETKTLPLALGDWVRYHGNSRYYELDGKVGQFTSVKCNAFGVAVSYGVAYANMDDLVWAAAWAWELVTKAEEEDLKAVKTFDIEDIFTNAAGGPLAVAKAEIERLETRIAELKAAVKVIESL